jgi:hypothetical protein
MLLQGGLETLDKAVPVERLRQVANRPLTSHRLDERAASAGQQIPGEDSRLTLMRKFPSEPFAHGRFCKFQCERFPLERPH